MGAGTTQARRRILVDSLSITTAMNTSLSSFTRRIILAAAIIAAAAASSAIVAGCEREGPAERAGKDIDKAAKDAGKAVEDAGKRIQEKSR
jgi:hypothetical protein